MATRKRRKTLRAVPTPMPTALFRGGVRDVVGADVVEPACTRGGGEGLARGRRTVCMGASSPYMVLRVCMQMHGVK